MSDPRNRQAYERGQEHRTAIKAFLLDWARRYPLRRSPTGKVLQARFPSLALSTVLWHVAEIRAEAEAESDTLETV